MRSRLKSDTQCRLWAVLSLLTCWHGNWSIAQTFVPDPLPAPTDFPYKLQLQAFASHSGSHAIEVSAPHDGSGNVYVSTQSGQIFGYDASGNSLGVFLDLSGTSATTGFQDPGNFIQGENGPAFRGLMYFDFHPDYAVSGAAGQGKVYTTFRSVRSFGEVDYASPSPGSEFVIAEWQVSTSNANLLDLGSYREVMRLAMSGSNPHAIGTVAFNPHAAVGDEDYGLLYAAIGDAGSTGNVVPAEGYIQEIDNPFGKMLRLNPLDPDGPGGSDYSTPSSNPFVGTSGAAAEIYALGFRDPQTFSFAKDSRGETVLITFDIGATQREEVDLVRPGQNYGWVRYEGTLGPGEFVPDTSTTANDGYFRDRPLYNAENTPPSPPVLEYDHLSGGFAISGGLVVSDPGDPTFRNRVIFTDLVNGRFYHADYEEMLVAEAFGTQATIYESQVSFGEFSGTFADVVDGVAGGRGDARFGTDEAGNVYVVSKRSHVVYSTGLVDTSSGPFDSPPIVTLQIDRRDGEIVLTNELATPLDLDGYEITSSNGLLNPAGWVSFAEQGIAGWQEAPNSSDHGLAEFNPTPGQAFVLQPGASASIGVAYTTDPTAAMEAVGFGNEYEDVAFRFSSDSSDSVVKALAVRYVGERRENNLVVEIDPNTGQATLINDSPFQLALDFFQVASDSDTLDPSFLGLSEDGSPVPGWQSTPNNNSTAVAQFYPFAGGFVVPPNAQYELGHLLLADSSLAKLEFEFLLNGESQARTGVVRELPDMLLGDFNGDGVVTLADYTVWRDALGGDETLIRNAGNQNQIVDAGDYTVWKQNFGRQNDGTFATQKVAEPTTFTLGCWFVTGCFVLRSRITLLGAGRRSSRRSLARRDGALGRNC